MYPRWFNEKMVKTCPVCERKFYPLEWKSTKRIYRESEVRYTSRIYCGDVCRLKYQADKPPEQNYFYGKHLVPWNAGKRRDWLVKQQSGYMRIIKAEGGIDYEHRRVVKCPKGMVVHHIDGNKSNNDISNLRIMTAGEHTRLHHKKHGNKSVALAN